MMKIRENIRKNMIIFNVLNVALLIMISSICVAAISGRGESMLVLALSIISIAILCVYVVMAYAIYLENK